MLDNVLDATLWPLPQQREEASAKRRIGLGFTGLGDALVDAGPALRQRRRRARWRSASPRRCATQPIARRSSSRAEKGAFPLFDADATCRRAASRSRLPEAIRRRRSGARHSQLHLLSIAPTGTIRLAFADNACNGIEPPFSWTYTRKKRMPRRQLAGVQRRGPRLAAVPAHARRREPSCRPPSSRALEMSAAVDHADGRGGAALHRRGDQQDGQRAGGLSVTRTSEISI